MSQIEIPILLKSKENLIKNEVQQNGANNYPQIMVPPLHQTQNAPSRTARGGDTGGRATLVLLCNTSY